MIEDQGGAGTRIRRAGSSTTGIDRHTGPTSTLGGLTRGTNGTHGAGPTSRRAEEAEGAGEI